MGRSDDDQPLDEATPEEREREERAAILKRRSTFVASALASLSLAAGCSDSPAAPCLSVSTVEGSSPAGSSATPPVTASATSEPPDAGVDAGGDDAGATSSTASAPQTAPQPCLEVAPPRPCLKIAPPPKPPPRPCLNVAKPDD